MTSYFQRTGPHRLLAGPATSGAWSTSEQHIAPLTGLVVHELERYVAARGADDLQVARIGFEILGVIGLEEFDVTVEVVRPGRTVELLEVVVSTSRPVLRARVWRLARRDTTKVAGGAAEPLPDPTSLDRFDLSTVWPGDYIGALEMRPVRPPEPGRTTTWVSTPVSLVPDEPVSDLARLVGLVDTANGIGVRESPEEWLFPNVDLSIHLHRQPTGPWLGLDTSTVFGDDGLGVTTSVLHDLDGAFGRAEQVLTLRPAE